MERLLLDSFLLRPRPTGTESFRGFLCRLASVNLIPRYFRPYMHRLDSLTEMTFGLDADESMKVASLNLRVTAVPGYREVRVGHDRLPGTSILLSVRRVCPACLADSGISCMAWEVKACVACPTHRCLLVSKCPGCDRDLTWKTSDASECSCGQVLANLAREVAPRWAINLARLVVVAVKTSMKTRTAAATSNRAGTPLRLEKLLLLIDVIRHILIPAYVGAPISRETERELLVNILRDRAYRDHVWEEIFLHAAADPLGLAQVLRPGQGADVVRKNFGALVDVWRIPAVLWSRPALDASAPMRARLAERGLFRPWLHGVGFCHVMPQAWLTEEEDWNDEEIFADDISPGVWY